MEDKTYILLRTLDELNSEYVLLRWSVYNNNNEINDKSEKYKVFFFIKKDLTNSIILNNIMWGKILCVIFNKFKNTLK